MKKMYRMLVLGLLAGLLFGGILWAEDGDRSGAVRGTFVRLVEREVGERGYMGIVIKPFERDEHVTVLVPRQREELWQAARRLQEGQEVSVSFVTEAGHKFIKGMEAEWREVIEEGPEGRRTVNVRREVLRLDDDFRERREAERPTHLEQMEGQLKEVVSEHLERMGRALKEVLGAHLERMEAELRELRAHIERMQEELQGLRAENERLRWQLRERGGPERERGREIRIRREVEERREDREREERERRERAEGRARGERPESEREVLLHRLEVMRMALPALKEAERWDAVELLTLAIRDREMMLERRNDEEANRIRERAPSRERLVDILSMAAELWREFGNDEKSAVVGQLAEQLSGVERRQVREQEEREIRREREAGREADNRREGMEREEREVRRRMER
jgi:regulator of replication initiation timing